MAGNRVAQAAAKLRALMMDYAYMITLGAAIAVIAGGAIYTQHMQSAAPAAAGAPEIRDTPVVTAEPTAAPLPTMPAYAAPRLGGATVRTVSGGVLRGFDAQKPVFWEAMACMKVHAGLDMAGSAGEDVLCAMDGTVESAVRDGMWGWRVSVAQTDGRTAVYAGLASCAVQAQQHVTRGQALGTLLERIPCEAEMDTHLHLELYEEGKAVDPAPMLPDKQKK